MTVASDQRSAWPRLAQGALGLACGAAFVFVLTGSVDFDRVTALMATANPWPLVLGAAAYCLSFVIRVARFATLLEASHEKKPSLRNSFGPFVASFGVSDILPLRIGDGFRIYWFNQQFGIAPGTIAGAMLFERILDLVGLALIGVGAMLLVGLDARDPATAAFALVIGGALAVGLALLLTPAVLKRLLQALFPGRRPRLVAATVAVLETVTSALASIGSWRRIGTLTLVSLTIWLLESVVLLSAWISLGGAIGAAKNVLLPFTFSTLGTLVPSLPGHFGSYEYFGLQAFQAIGIEDERAMAVLVIAHLILWLPTALFAIFWLIGRSGHAGHKRRLMKSA